MDALPCLAAALALALAAAPAPTRAQQVLIEKKGCKAGVHLVANKAPASVVLAQLSQQLGFELKFEADRDRVLDVDLTRRGPELVGKLMDSDNVIYDVVPDPKCPGRQRLSKVWVLPRGEDGPPRPHEPTPMEMYRKAHGLPPQDDKDKPAATPDAR